MAVKLMHILNDDTQNNPFYRLKVMVESLNTQLNETTNQNLTKEPKNGYKTLGTSLIYRPMSPPSLYVYYTL